MKPFKGALCLAHLPDFYYGGGRYEYRCKRHKEHPGRHRVVFRDGGVREWGTGDDDSELTRGARDGG